MLPPTVRDDVGEISCHNFEDGGGDFNYDDEKSEEIASADLEISHTYFYEKVQRRLVSSPKL